MDAISTAKKCHYCGSDKSVDNSEFPVSTVYSLARLEFGKSQVINVCNRAECAKKAKEDGYEIRFDLTYRTHRRSGA